MKPIRIPLYIYDPRPSFCQELASLLTQFIIDLDLPLTLRYVGNQPDEVLQTLSEGGFSGIFFLSSNQENPSDLIQLGQTIRQHDYLAKIIYLASSTQLMTQVVRGRIEALDMILIDSATRDLVTNADCSTQIQDNLVIACQRLLTNRPSNPLFTYREGESLYALPTSQLLSLETGPKAHQLTLWTSQGSSSFYGRLSETLSTLPPYFIRISRSEVVNLHQVTGIHLASKSMTLSDGRTVYMATRYLPAIRLALKDGAWLLQRPI